MGLLRGASRSFPRNFLEFKVMMEFSGSKYPEQKILFQFYSFKKITQKFTPMLLLK